MNDIIYILEINQNIEVILLSKKKLESVVQT